MAGNFFDKFDGRPDALPPARENQIGAQTAAGFGNANRANVSAAAVAPTIPYVKGKAEAQERSAKSAAEIAGQNVIKKKVEARSLPILVAKQAKDAADAIDRILTNEAFPKIVGRNVNLRYGMVGHRSDSEDTDMAGMPRLLWGNTKAADLVADLKRLQSMAYIQGRKQMAGQGSIQAGEALRALGSVASLDVNQNPVTWAKQAIDLRNRLRSSSNTINGVYAEEKARAAKQGLTAPDEGSSFEILSVEPLQK